MVAYSFKSRFVPLITSGVKRQTIRARRNGKMRHAHAQDALQLFHGDRFHPQRIGRATCLLSGACILSFDTDRVSIMGWRGLQMIARPVMLDAFARQDGFQDWADMARFWLETHDARTFGGVRIFWGDTFVPHDAQPAGDAGEPLPQENLT